MRNLIIRKNPTNSLDPVIIKKFIRIVLPIAGQNLLSSLVSASDAIMLSGLNQSSLSAVSLATQVSFVISLFYMSLTTGATILAAQYWGKGDKDTVEDTLSITLKYSVGISAVFWLACLCIPGWLMRIFTNDTELIQLGIPYLQIVSWSYLIMGITQTYLCIMKNTDRIISSTVYSIIAMISNVILNALFIYGLLGFPKMEVAGAALATVIARIIELLFVIWENTKKGVIKIRLQKLFTKHTDLNRDFVRYTLPVLGNSLAWGCGITMYSVILGHMGNDAVAANSIASIVKNIICCVCWGIGAGAGIIVGNVLGTDDLEGARRLGDKLCHLAIISGVISGLIILAISPVVITLTTTLTPVAKGYLQIMLIICSYYVIGASINTTVISGIFCAGGDTRFGLICDTITLWAVVVPIGLIAAFVFKLPVLWVYFLINIDELIKLPWVYKHYKKYNWVKNITKENQ